MAKFLLRRRGTWRDPQLRALSHHPRAHPGLILSRGAALRAPTWVFSFLLGVSTLWVRGSSWAKQFWIALLRQIAGGPTTLLPSWVPSRQRGVFAVPRCGRHLSFLPVPRPRVLSPVLLPERWDFCFAAKCFVIRFMMGFASETNCAFFQVTPSHKRDFFWGGRGGRKKRHEKSEHFGFLIS